MSAGNHMNGRVEFQAESVIDELILQSSAQLLIHSPMINLMNDDY